MKISWQLIVFLISLVLACVCSVLIVVWQSFVIFTGAFLLVCSVIFTAYRLKKHKTLKNNLNEQRYCDAYIYADENNLEFNQENFSYDKKTEKAIKNKLNNSLVLVLSGYAFCALSIFLFIIGCINA